MVVVLAMGPSLDPLRYGLRALDEMAREQASVGLPPQSTAERFSPHTELRPPARDGALLSLRLFTEAVDDATALVVGDASTQRFDPIPPRAGPFFEAHAAALAAEADDAITVGFPLVTFVQHGATRAAPLFSRGGSRARWRIGDAPWALAPGFRLGATLPVPDALVLELGDEPYTLHAGVWHFLFGLDGAALAAVGDAGRAGLGALVRVATRCLKSGGEDVDSDSPSGDALTREDLALLAEEAVRRAAPSRTLRCYLHGLAMLPARGDPTSGLRTELRALLDQPLPARGPLAVYLGAPAAAPRGRAVVTSGKMEPSPSQLEAARAFEGTEDLVAVCGPPGCGKTALLHHVAAQTVVACALGTLWSSAPSRTTSWPLVVASTNNAAVDHALAPFVSGPALPVGIRLGSRRALAETTAAALASALEVLDAPGAVSLASARAAFEARAAPVRAFLRARTASRKARESETERQRTLERRAAKLRATLAQVPDAPLPSLGLADLDVAIDALREHAEAASRLAPVHLDGKRASVARACEKWARANALRAPRIAPALVALGLGAPFGDLDARSPREDIKRQRAAIDKTLTILAASRAVLTAPALRDELAAITRALAATVVTEASGPPLDPGLYDAALVVRDAWARAHRDVLLPRLAAARDATLAERTDARGKPLVVALREIAPLFPLAGCTLLSMRASFPIGHDIIDRLVIDEAAQCAPIYAVPALARARRAMLTGDVAQLPPVYTLDPRVDDRLARGLDAASVASFRMSSISTSSAQAVGEPRARTRLSLTEHFRSQRAIVELASRWSGYTLDVRTPPRSLAHISRRLAEPVVAVSVCGVGARAPEGIVNESEVALASDLVAELVVDGVAPSDIAVLTPFVGQCVRIERELMVRGLARDGILVSTVHRLQGGERRVVVFSLTATERRHLRWIGERPHLLHVAASRAREHLIVLFDPTAASREAALAPLCELLRAAELPSNASGPS